MPEFRFVAATAANERQEGLLEAGGVVEAAAELSRRGLLVIRVTPQARRGSLWVHAKAPFGQWGTQTFIAGLPCDRLSAPWVIDKAMNRAAFD